MIILSQSGSGYCIYDHGLNPKKTALESNTRKALGMIEFTYDQMGPGRLNGCIPRVKENGIPFTWIDTDDSVMDTMKKKYDQQETDNIMILRNKRPKYDDRAGGHVLNFHGRVTMSSVKNFQMSCDDTNDETVLQFGRVSCPPVGPYEQCKCHKNHFTLDFQYPLSPLQAFGICLASVDGKLADSKGFDKLRKFSFRK